MNCSHRHGLIAACVLMAFAADLGADSNEAVEGVAGLAGRYCHDCHDSETAKGGLDLTKTPFALEDRKWRDKWVLIFDRIEKKEMPPKAEKLPAAERAKLLEVLDKALHAADLADVRANGRGTLRRLTRAEYEHNLRDLLRLPSLDIRDKLPEDRTSGGFSKVSDTLDLSRVQMEAYLNAAEAALLEAVAKGMKPIAPEKRRIVGTDLYPKVGEHGGREAMFFAKEGRMVPISNADVAKANKTGKRDEELEVGVFRSATWPYYAYPRGFLAKRDGAYRVRFSARAVLQKPGFWMVPASRPLGMTFRARQPSAADVSGDVRATGGWIDIQPEQAEYETTVLLKKGETFEYSLFGLPVPHPITSHGGPLYYNFPPMPPDGHPGVAFQWLEIEGPLQAESWPPESHRVLFGGLSLAAPKPGSGLPVRVHSENPRKDAARLLKRFARRAARRPVNDGDLAPLLKLIHAELDSGASFAEAMLAGYQAFLCSGRFLYLNEPKGGGHAARRDVAERLAHFLWNTGPDSRLQKAAAKEGGLDSQSLQIEVGRLIADDRFDRFVENFTDEWLDLDELKRDLPDIRLYPEYRKDDYLIESMRRETRMYFRAMIRENLPATTLVDSDFAYVNDRLARHYGLRAVDGSALRKTPLPEWSPFGGLMTQGAIMKVTANGATTSPVIRGAWIMKNIVGDPPPKPPAAVPAVEPDIRGAKTIKEILKAHTRDKACSGCHARFDPVGFALENFDIMGAWRAQYRGLERGDKITGVDPAGHAFEYRVGAAVESSGRLLNGESFADIRDLKKILAADPRQLARNLLRQFTLYSTGVPVRYSDRREIEAILDACQADGYRVGDLLRGLVGGRVFLGGFPP